MCWQTIHHSFIRHLYRSDRCRNRLISWSFEVIQTWRSSKGTVTGIKMIVIDRKTFDTHHKTHTWTCVCIYAHTHTNICVQDISQKNGYWHCFSDKRKACLQLFIAALCVFLLLLWSLGGIDSVTSVPPVMLIPQCYCSSTYWLSKCEKP